MMITDQIFVGIEVEGTGLMQGIPTVFFPKGVLQEADIPKVMQTVRSRGINRFYFGAGNRRGLTELEARFLDTLPSSAQVLVEITEKDVPEVAELMKFCINVQFVLVVDTPRMLPIAHVKQVDATKVWWKKLRIGSWDETLLDDPRYKQDKAIP